MSLDGIDPFLQDERKSSIQMGMKKSDIHRRPRFDQSLSSYYPPSAQETHLVIFHCYPVISKCHKLHPILKNILYLLLLNLFPSDTENSDKYDCDHHYSSWYAHRYNNVCIWIIVNNGVRFTGFFIIWNRQTKTFSHSRIINMWLRWDHNKGVPKFKRI